MEYVALYVDMLVLEGVYFSVVCMLLYLSSGADAQIEAFWERGQRLCQQTLQTKTQLGKILLGNHAVFIDFRRPDHFSCPDHPR